MWVEYGRWVGKHSRCGWKHGRWVGKHSRWVGKHGWWVRGTWQVGEGNMAGRWGNMAGG